MEWRMSYTTGLQSQKPPLRIVPCYPVVMVGVSCPRPSDSFEVFALPETGNGGDMAKVINTRVKSHKLYPWLMWRETFFSIQQVKQEYHVNENVIQSCQVGPHSTRFTQSII